MKLVCPKFVVLNQNLNCSLFSLNYYNAFNVVFDFGDGTNLTYYMNTGFLSISKIYIQTGSFNITAIASTTNLNINSVITVLG